MNEELYQILKSSVDNTGLPVMNSNQFISVTDKMGGTSDYYVMNEGITVQNNIPEISTTGIDTNGDGEPDPVVDGENPTFEEGGEIELSIEIADEDGDISNVTWYVDIDGDGEMDDDELLAWKSNPAQGSNNPDNMNYEVLEVGENQIININIMKKR